MDKINKPIFLSGLNGLRTIAAIGVLMSHINLSLGNFGVKSISLFGFDKGMNQKSWVLGEHGVTIFFVLSGFLITFLLLKEYAKTNTVRIKHFYIRRALRIWPLYYLYVGLVLIVIFFSHELDFNLVYYLTFFANIPFINSTVYPAMGHLWSISVEEQFYLFWPFLFLILVKNQFVKKITIIIALLAFFRVFIWYIAPFSIPALISVVNRFDCMMFGALGGYLVFKESNLIKYFNSKIVQIVAWLVMFLMMINVFHFFNSIVEIFVVELATLIIIIGQINIKNRIINLENAPLSYLGKLSFGIYVYHPLIILLFSKFVNPNWISNSNEIFSAFCVFLVIIIATIGISHLSYFKFENKFLKFKYKFSVIKSTNNISDVQ